CVSELALPSNWTDIEKRCSKIGHNGYKQKEVSINVKNVPLTHKNGVTLHRGISAPCGSVANLSSSNSDVFHKDKLNLVSNVKPIQAKQIVSSKGTVRGFRNRVRAGIVTFLEQQNGHRAFRHKEKGKIIIYTTSMSVIRQTSDRCRVVKKILQNHMIRYEEKDLFMNKEHQKELVERLNTNRVILPQVFIDGIHLGGAEDLVQLNEVGDLKELLEDFERIDVKSSCSKCGGYRFIPCVFCHGSKKSSHRNNFTENFCALRCMQCDENGLLRCDMCLEQQE
ncbi:hypothetical protein ScPMuIL_010853, partial [Solemya velum]